MAHGDCENCGAYHGMDYGLCHSCTPEEYLDFRSFVDHELQFKEYKWQFEEYVFLENYEEYVKAYTAYNEHKPKNEKEKPILQKQELWTEIEKDMKEYFQELCDELEEQKNESVQILKRLAKV